MEDRIRRALVNVRKQKYPLTEALDGAFLCENQVSELMKEFWIPNEILEQTCDRIRSSSMDDPAPPTPPEQLAMNDLKEECGIDISQIIRSISVLNDGIDGKLEELRDLEISLKESEDVINHYNQSIQTFCSSIETLPININISGQNMFLESLNHSIFQHVSMNRVPEKLKRFQYLLTQIRMIRKIAKVSRITESRSGSMPICNICFTENITCALVPCGHMFCDSCLANISNDNKCFTCRRRSSRILRLYPN
jgi:hypothetical protein